MDYPIQNGQLAMMGQGAAPASPGAEQSHASKAAPEVGETRFRCHICDEPSEEICPRCTRDVCGNHICEHCGQCSDCCDCEWIHR